MGINCMVTKCLPWILYNLHEYKISPHILSCGTVTYLYERLIMWVIVVLGVNQSIIPDHSCPFPFMPIFSLSHNPSTEQRRKKNIIKNIHDV